MNFAIESRTPSPGGRAPPERPVPAPRGTTGTFMEEHVSSTRCTCSSVSGSATTIGSWRYAVSPSHS
jgi:hypothetical protein